jgi:hypothetical protein
VTVCLYCGVEFRGPVDLEAHWDQGRCRSRPPDAFYELVEDRNGELRPRRIRG